MTLASIADIVVYSDATKPPDYTITSLELEYRFITSDYLAQEATASYQTGKGFFYKNIVLHKTFTISKGGDSVINEHINLPRRSMTGILCLFTTTYAPGSRDSEKFVNPDMKTVKD